MTDFWALSKMLITSEWNNQGVQASCILEVSIFSIKCHIWIENVFFKKLTERRLQDVL